MHQAKTLSTDWTETCRPDRWTTSFW